MPGLTALLAAAAVLMAGPAAGPLPAPAVATPRAPAVAAAPPVAAPTQGRIRPSHARLSELPAHQLVWKQWTVSEGLPQITVNDIVQDPAGYLWVATQDGVARFDGLHFETFQYPQHAALGHNIMMALAIDRDGMLWAASMVGIVRYRDGQWHAVPVAEGAPAPGVITDLRPHPDGGVWATAEGGLYYANDKEVRVVPLDLEGRFALNLVPATDAEPAVAITPSHLVFDPDGEARIVPLKQSLGGALSAGRAEDGGLWVGTISGLLRVDAQGVVLQHYAPGREVEDLLVDNAGTVWFATDGGLWRLPPGAPRAESLQVPGIPSTDWVRRVFIDREANLWVGTQVGGLHRAWPDRFRRIAARDGLVNSAVWLAYEAPNGELWAGTTEGLYRGGLDGFSRVFGAEDLPHPSVMSLLRDRQGTLWIGTQKGLAYWRPAMPRPRVVESLSRTSVVALLEEPDGSVLVGMLDGLFQVRDGQVQSAPLPASEAGLWIGGLAYDGLGRLWVGNQNGVLYRDKDRWLVPQHLSARPMALTFLPLDDDGLLATGYDGLFHISPRGMRTLGRAEGIHANMVNGINLTDNDLWYLTSLGIGRIGLESLRALLRGERQRLEVSVYGDLGSAHLAQCNGGQQQAGIFTGNRWLWCPSLQGLLVFDTARADERAPAVSAALQALTTPQRRIALDIRDAPLELAANERDVELSFTGLWLRAPERLQFHARLLGYDTAWQSLGARRVSYYTNLPPGTYTYELYAINEDGIAGPIQRLEFAIRPFWHETWWARAAGVLLVLVLVWWWTRHRLRALQRQRQQLEQRVHERTAELEQVNQKLESASVTDPLTGLHNRRFLQQHLPHELARVDRVLMEYEGDSERVLSVLHVDLDRFKQVNDSHGHHVGDQVLQAAAELLRASARASDFVLRWGGEEFLIVGRDTRRSELGAWAERIVRQFRQHEFVTDAGPLRITCSVGFAVYPPHPDDRDLAGWNHTMILADAATYVAKQEGRDRSVGLEWLQPRMSEDLGQRLHTDLAALVEQGAVRVLRGGGAIAGP